MSKLLSFDATITVELDDHKLITTTTEDIMDRLIELLNAEKSGVRMTKDGWRDMIYLDMRDE